MTHICPACSSQDPACLCTFVKAGIALTCPVEGHPLPHLMRPAKSIDRTLFGDFMNQPDGRSGELH